MGNQSQRFLQAGVTRLALLQTAAELLRRKPASDFSLQRLTSGRSIDHPLDVHGLHVAADARQAHRQQIHDEAGIDPRSDYPRAGFLAESIQSARQNGLP